MSSKKAMSPGVNPDVWFGNVINFNTLKRLFNLKKDADVAFHLRTNGAAVSRFNQGKVEDIAGLTPTVLASLFPGVSEIALRAQLMEHELRALNAQKKFYRVEEDDDPASFEDLMQEKIEDCEHRLARLREWYNEMRSPITTAKRVERQVDRAALASLEGQLSIYSGDHYHAAVALSRCCSYLDMRQFSRSDVGPRVLFVRATLNGYFANHQLGKNVTASVMDTNFASIAADIASITGDYRILVLVAEAFAENKKHHAAAALLCDAAHLMGIPVGDLPSQHPIGFARPLNEKSVFAETFDLTKEVETRRRDLAVAKARAQEIAKNDLDFDPDMPVQSINP